MQRSIIVAVAITGLWLAWLVRWSPEWSDRAVVAASAHAAAPALPSSTAARDGAAPEPHDHGDAALARLDAALSHTLPPAARLDPFQRRYRQPALSDPTHFRSEDARLARSPECASHPVFGQRAATAAETLLAQTHGIDSRERWPADYFFRTLTQFWTLGDEHYQISAIWDLGRPAVYRFEFYASPTPDFAADVLAVTPPIAPPERADALSATGYIAALAALYERQGARMGQRLIEAEISAPDGALTEVRLADARVLHWQMPDALCVSSADATTLHCQCLPGITGAGDARPVAP